VEDTRLNGTSTRDHPSAGILILPRAESDPPILIGRRQCVGYYGGGGISLMLLIVILYLFFNGRRTRL
jgi:hypothetical protein